MLRLYVLRHAKSSWAAAGQTDFQRQLNERGVEDSSLIGAAMAKAGHVPATIYCSPATRTRETLKYVMAGSEAAVKTEFPEQFYSGSSDEYLDVLQGCQTPDPVMIIGHNPTCAILVSNLCSQGERTALDVLRYKYPTGTLAVIDLEANSWDEVREGSGYLVELIMPKSLREMSGNA